MSKMEIDTSGRTETEFEHTIATLRHNHSVEAVIYEQIRRDLSSIRDDNKIIRVWIGLLVILNVILAMTSLGLIIIL